MDVAEPLDVGEHLVGAGSGDRAGGLEGVADQNDAGLAMAVLTYRSAGRILTSPVTSNSPVIRRSRGSAAFIVCAGRGASAAARDRRSRDRRTDWRASYCRSETASDRGSGRSSAPRSRSAPENRTPARPTGTRSKPSEIEWQALTIWRSMPSWWRSPTFNPLASTTRRAEIFSPFESVTFCRSALVEIDDDLGEDRFDASAEFRPGWR